MMKPRTFAVAGAILLAAFFRILPHPPNVTPIAAMALFGGAYCSGKRWAYVIAFAAMFLSDLFLGFHQLMFLVYGCFALSVWVGSWVGNRKNVVMVAGASLFCSILFFVVTNFGVWALGTMYAKSWAGLAACYLAAIPFFRQTALGDLFYVTVLFGGFHLAQRWVPAFRETVPIRVV